MWAIGLPAALAAAFTGGLGWWMRRHWLSPRAAAAHLDRVLGLQQRLITAEEFAQAPHRSALYPLLLEDAARQCAPGGVRLPRPFSHTAGMLAVAALLLLLWPRLNPVLPPFVRQPEPEPPPSQQPAPPEPDQEADGAQGAGEAQPRSDAGQPSGNGGGHQPEQPSAAGQQPSADSAPAAGDEPRRSAGEQQPGAGQQAASGQQQTTPQQASDGSRPREQSQQGNRRGESRSDGDDSRGTPRPGDHDSRGTPAGQSGAQSPTKSSQAQRAASAQQQAAGSGQKSQDGRSGGSTGEGEALKAEIQELLKEVSGELKDLQAQLASATDQPKPEAGTGTDPNLYEAPMTLEDGGDPLAIQLPSDTAPTEARRPGGGVGQPSGEVSGAAPQTQAQEAQLSEQPLEEAPASRQPVPEEYRDVFDRLQRRSTP